MHSLQILLDNAAKKCGSDAELARRIDVSRSLISILRSGKQPITPEIAGLLAEITGDDIAKAVLRATLDQMAKTKRGQRVREAIKERFLDGAKVAFVIFATVGMTTFSEPSQSTINHSIHRIK